MKTTLWTAMCAVMIASTAGEAIAAERRLNIVTTTTDLASIARSVGGDRVRVRSLQNGTRDPHFLQAKPTYIVMARKADLWVRVGMELEIGYEPVILNSSRNRRIKVGSPGHLDVSQNVIRLDVPTKKVNRSMGDVHPEGNPHYWLDPYNGRIVAREIVDRLKRLDPAGAKVYEANLAAFTARLDGAMFGKAALVAMKGDELWKQQCDGGLQKALRKMGIGPGGWYGALLPHSGAKVGTHHRSWNYLLGRFGLVLGAELEPKPGIPPSPRHLTEALGTVKAAGIKAFMVEPFYSRKAADFIAARTGARVVVCANATGGQPEATDYIAMIDNAVRKLAAALGGSDGN